MTKTKDGYKDTMKNLCFANFLERFLDFFGDFNKKVVVKYKIFCQYQIIFLFRFTLTIIFVNYLDNSKNFRNFAAQNHNKHAQMRLNTCRIWGQFSSKMSRLIYGYLQRHIAILAF